MPDEGDGFEFEAIPTPAIITSKAKAESDQLESRPIDLPPNSVSIKIGSFCQIHWRADSSVPVFCFVAIVILLVFGLLFALISTINPNVTWAGDVFKLLGQAVLTLIGAVVGSAATGASPSRSRKPNSRL